MLKGIVATGLAAFALVLAAQPAAGQGQSCFYPNQWTNWTAPDDHTIYLKVGARVFRLDLASACTGLRQGATLITRTSGSSQYCSAIDWNLKVRNGGVAVACIVSKMTQLTPDQVAALPKSVAP